MIRIILVATLLHTPAWGGQEVGSGGDVVQCRTNTASSLSGPYSLDYLLTYDANANPLFAPATVTQSLERIQDNLNRKLPELAASFEDYRRLLFNKNANRARIWEEAPFGLREIDDENLPAASQLPANCKNGSKIQLVQTVVRLFPSFSGAKPGTVIYKFMPQFLNQLAMTSPLQASFVLVHEWLWDHSPSVDRNRRLNRFFHSQDFTQMSRAEILAVMENLGFALSSAEQDRAFFPHSCETHVDEIPRLLARLSSIRPTASSLKLGVVEVRKRYRRCEANGMCTNWSINRQISESYNTMALLQNDVRLQQIQLRPVLATSSRKNVGLCTFNSSGAVECQDLVFNGWEFPARMNGVISNSCLRVEYSNRIEEFGGWMDEQLVLFSSFTPL